MARFEQIAVRLLPLFVVVACEADTALPTAVSLPQPTLAAASTTVASISVSPDSQMVFAGDQFTIVARPKNSAGQVVNAAVTWTVRNTAIAKVLGTTAATMTFKALKAGVTTIKATAGGRSRSAKVVVRTTSGAKVVVTPSEATVAAGKTVQLVATGLTKLGETAAVNVKWTATGGTISTGGLLTAGTTAGAYRAIATALFGKADTSAITITAAAEPLADLVLVPASAEITAGETVQFEVYGHTPAGDSVGVAVTYTATGGTISSGGLYAAGGTAGTYQVTARSASGVTAIAPVIVNPAPIDHIVLMPGVAASRPNQTTRFAVTAVNTLGATVPATANFESTCGTISGTGVFTAPDAGAGSCFVTATVGDKTATTEVVPLQDLPGRGIPFGIYDLWSTPSTTQSSGVAAFTGSHEYIEATSMVARIQAARALGIRLVLAMTGGSHDRYKTNGVFDEAKWQAAVDEFNTPAIQDAIAEGVADGTIMGNSVMDEPQQSGTDFKDWGPPGTMTKARVDGLCDYVKDRFPTLPVGVGHDHEAFEPQNSYHVCEFLMVQYAARKGNVVNWRDGALALGARDGMAIVFSLNLLNGGVQDRTGAWDCPGTGGLGTRSPNCRMTATQIRDWGTLLGQSGCAMLSWMYDSGYMNRPENEAAFSQVAIALSQRARPPCTLR